MKIVNLEIRREYKYLCFIEDKKGKRTILNNNDVKVLLVAMNECCLSDIAREIRIDVKNVSVRIDKLMKLGLISCNNYGTNKKFIKTIIEIPQELSETVLKDKHQELNLNGDSVKSSQ